MGAPYGCAGHLKSWVSDSYRTKLAEWEQVWCAPKAFCWLPGETWGWVPSSGLGWAGLCQGEAGPGPPASGVRTSCLLSVEAVADPFPILCAPARSSASHTPAAPFLE